MLEIKRTTSHNTDFIKLVEKLDAYLAITDGDDHAFYDQFNSIESLKYVVVAYVDKDAVACGAVKQFDEDSMEVKRVFTSEIVRGKGIATQVLRSLEAWSAELDFTYCVLETGVRQTEAVKLYEKCGYQRIPNYGQYKDVADSICFKKELNKK